MNEVGSKTDIRGNEEANVDETYYITTPIYYVNDKPHIGHTYTTVLADVVARYRRLAGDDVRFLTGTDEHGQKVQVAAQKAGRSPQEHADALVGSFQGLWKVLNVSNDDFIRTTEPRHVAVVQKALQDLFDGGDIYQAEHEGLYDPVAEQFVSPQDAPSYPAGALTQVKEKDYFFRMAKHQEWLVQYITDNPGFVQPEYRRNEVLGFLRKPLQDLCISRPKSRLEWGIELPFDKDFVAYVWFDALLNYVSAAAGFWPASCHLIGKDILTFHAVYWSTMLHALGLPLPKTIFAHGWWLVDSAKMGKSAGNAVDPIGLVAKYGADAFRYFLASAAIPGKDAVFSERDFVIRYNAKLANDFGNVFGRVLKLAETWCGCRVPRAGVQSADDVAFRDAVLSAAVKVLPHARELRVDLAVEDASTIVSLVNCYLDAVKPWALAKAGNLDGVGTCLYNAFEALRIASGLLYPVIPEKAVAARTAIGVSLVPDSKTLCEWGVIVAGTEVHPIPPLFPRVPLPKEV